MQIFIILVIINFILDSKATPTTSKATLIKKIELLVDANGVLTENYLLIFKNENNEAKRYSVSYIKT